MTESENKNDLKPPITEVGWLGWIRKNLFGDWFSGLLTFACLYLIWKIGFPALQWAVLDSHWSGTADDCRGASGACWSFVRHNYRFILFGFYPYEEQWRPALCIAIFVGMLFISKNPIRWSRKLLYGWLVVFVVIAVVMRGGLAGLSRIDNNVWGGLTLTLLLAVVGITLAYPLGILLALGRQSRMPAIKMLCVAYIELIRGVPLISLLFMASVMLPLFLPEGLVPDKLLRAQIAIVLFAAAYIAEVVRGGLQAIPRGQYDAAQAIGLSDVHRTRLIILPQALKIVIPPTVSIFISTLKDTSLVVIIALFDLLHTAKATLSNPDWLGFSTEAYVFVALIYFLFCFSMARYSVRLESILSPEKSGSV